MKKTLKIVLIVLAIAAVVCIKLGILKGNLGLLSTACTVLAAGLILSYFTKGHFTPCLTGLALGYILAVVIAAASLLSLPLLYTVLAVLAGALVAFAVERI